MNQQTLSPIQRKRAVKAAKELGYLQADIAKEIGITPDHLSKLLRRESRRSKHLAVLDQWLLHNILKEGVYIPSDKDFATNRGQLPGFGYGFFNNLSDEEIEKIGLEVRAYFNSDPYTLKAIDNVRNLITEHAVPPTLVPANVELYFYLLLSHVSDLASFLAYLGVLNPEEEVKLDININRSRLAGWRGDSESSPLDQE